MPSLYLGSFELRLRLWPTVAAVAGIALTLALGDWQLGRAREKQMMLDRYVERTREPALHIGAQETQAEDLALRRVEARGEFDPGRTIYLDNRVHRGIPGYEIVTPLRIQGSHRYVLVNRGWTAAGRDRASLPQIATPEGIVTVHGLAVVPSGRYLELSPEVIEGRVWQNLSLDRYRKATGLDLQPVVIQQEAGARDGLAREWAAPDYGRNTNLAYAFQWFAMAFAVLVYYLVTNVRKRSHD